MDLGLAFDDEDLSSNEKKSRDDTDLPYNVKICTPQWFEPALDTYIQGSTSSELDPEQIPHIFKFSGDFHYHQRNYEKAIARYIAALDQLPENNVSVKQDVRESLARCYSQTGETEKSLQLARELVLDMTTEDEAHQRQSLLLLSSVSERAGCWAECVDSLERLCIMQPYFAPFWNQLGDAYTNLFNLTVDADIKRGEYAVLNGGDGDAASADDSIRPLTCYIRASLLLQSVLSTASNLVKSRNETLINQISKKIDDIPFPQSVKASAFEGIQRDLENQTDESKDLKTDGSNMDAKEPSLNSQSDNPSQCNSQLFYHRFCSWYLKSCTKDSL